jgi:hypothetical protein
MCQKAVAIPWFIDRASSHMHALCRLIRLLAALGGDLIKHAPIADCDKALAALIDFQS